MSDAHYETRPLKPKSGSDSPDEESTSNESSSEDEQESASKAEEDEDESEISATSAAKDLAEEHGIDLSTVDGSGKDGRILKPDVESLIAS